MLRAAVFDFDGTIADTVAAIREGVNMTMRQYGFPEHTHDAIRSFINNGARELIRRSLPPQYRQDEPLLDRVLTDYDRYYSEVYLHTDRAYDGIPELVRTLHDEGLKIGVLSNKQHPFVQKLVAQVLLPGSFDAVQGVLPELPVKPDPAMPRRLAAQLGVEPAACVMIGDSDVDLRTAQNAGMQHIGVSWGYRSRDALLLAGATHVVDTPHALLCLLTAKRNSF